MERPTLIDKNQLAFHVTENSTISKKPSYKFACVRSA